MDLRDEKLLVEKAKHDPATFGKLFDHYYPKIFGYILRRTGSPEHAKDLTSQTFIKVMHSLPRFVWKAGFSSWIYRIATNEVNDFFRNGKKASLSLERLLRQYGYEPEEHIDLEEEIIKAEEKVEKQQLYLSVLSEIHKTDTRYQEVITLRFFEKKSIQEIAEILGKKEGTVKSLLSRGLSQLKAKFGAQGILQPKKEKPVIKSGGRYG